MIERMVFSGLRILDSKLIQNPCPPLNMKLQPVGPRNAHSNTERFNVNDLV
jgi:hypothetical protein